MLLLPIGFMTSVGAGGSPPNTVTSLAAGSATSTTIPLTWVESGGTPTTRTVTQRTPSGSGSYVSSTGTFGSTGGTVTGLSSGSTYDFQVVESNGSGSSGTATLTNVSTSSAGSIAYTVTNLTGIEWPTAINMAGAEFVGISGDVYVRGPSSQTPASLAFAIGPSGTVAPVSGTGDYGVNGPDSKPGVLLGDQGNYPQAWAPDGAMYYWKNGHTTGTTVTRYLWVVPTDSSGPPAVLTSSGTPIAITVTY